MCFKAENKEHTVNYNSFTSIQGYLYNDYNFTAKEYDFFADADDLCSWTSKVKECIEPDYDAWVSLFYI